MYYVSCNHNVDDNGNGGSLGFDIVLLRKTYLIF